MGWTQNYNFSYVRRFDRCTTCHQSLAKSLPGSATRLRYVHEELLELVVIAAGEGAPPKPRVDERRQAAAAHAGRLAGRCGWPTRGCCIPTT